MDAVKFIEERRRMFEATGKHPPTLAKHISAEELVREVEKWSAEHPCKTRQIVFLEQHHNAPLDNNGILQIRPCHIDKNFIHSKGANYCNPPCEICRRNYWSKEAGNENWLF